MTEGQWAAVRMPVWRQALAGYYDTLTAQLDTYPPLRANLEASMVSSGAIETAADLPAYLAGMREQWKASELYWIAGPMMRVALDASSDMPAFAPGAIVPAPFGFAVFAEPLPAIPWADADDTLDVPVDGVQWATFGGRVHVRVQHRVSRLPGRLGPTVAALPFFGSRELHLPAGVLADLDALPEPQWQGLWAAVAATWVLMEQPTVASQRVVTGAGSSARAWQRVPRTVRIIDLRTIEHLPTEEPGESGRVYTHRWLVRGHWRQQAVGVGRADRRLTWVPSYIKGPEGAPLLHQDHVHVWRR